MSDEQLEEARQTIARLNRRCQSAERGLEARLTSGFSFGRALANSAAVMWHEKHKDLEKKTAALLKAAKEACEKIEANLPKVHYHTVEAGFIWPLVKELRAAVALAEGGK